MAEFKVIEGAKNPSNELFDRISWGISEEDFSMALAGSESVSSGISISSKTVEKFDQYAEFYWISDVYA